MISEREKRGIDIILAKSVSRFGCDTHELLGAIRKIRVAEKRLIFERARIDTEAIGDKLLNSGIEACEQSENEWRSENIRWGLKKRAENGYRGYIVILAIDMKKTNSDGYHSRRAGEDSKKYLQLVFGKAQYWWDYEGIGNKRY